MTREGAEKVREAVKEIYKQCEETGSCGSCPLCDRKDLSCDDFLSVFLGIDFGRWFR